MPESDPSPDDRPSPIAWPKFQFSLRSQLIAVAIVAVILGLFVTVGQSFAQLAYYGILGCLLPTPLVICALFGSGELRTFSIGSLVPWLTFVHPQPLTIASQYRTPVSLFGLMLGSAVFMLILAVACGVLAVATRRWIERNWT